MKFNVLFFASFVLLFSFGGSSPINQEILQKLKTVNPNELLARLQKLIQGLIVLLEKVSAAKKEASEDLLLKALAAEDLFQGTVVPLLDSKKALIQALTSAVPKLTETAVEVGKGSLGKILDAKRTLVEAVVHAGPQISTNGQGGSGGTPDVVKNVICTVMCPHDLKGVDQDKLDRCRTVNNCNNPSQTGQPTKSGQPTRTKTELFGNEYEDYEEKS